MDKLKKNVAIIIGGLAAGGAEKWVIDHVSTAYEEVNFTIYCLEEKNQHFSPKCKTIFLSFSNILGHFFEALSKIRANRDIDIIHCNLNFSAWIYGLVAIALRKKLISHWHNDTRVFSKGSGFWRKTYFYTSRLLIAFFSRQVLCVSKNAEASFLEWNFVAKLRKNTKVVFCGTCPFEVGDYRYKRSDILRLGHFGRFVNQKNHMRLVEIFEKVLKVYPQSELHLFGEGPLENSIKNYVDDFDLVSKVYFHGAIKDVKRVMYEEIDVFVLPSLHEGLPIVCMEAQSVGLQTIIASSVSHEIHNKYLTHSISLNKSNEFWANRIVGLYLEDHKKLPWISTFDNSHFNLINSSSKIVNLYNE